MSKIYKSRHIPYRAFFKLLFNESNKPSERAYVIRRVHIGQFAKSLKCSNARAIDALQFLAALNFIEYKVEGKYVTVALYLTEDVLA